MSTDTFAQWSKETAKQREVILTALGELQRQKEKAEADIEQLRLLKEEALANPCTFVTKLLSGLFPVFPQRQVIHPLPKLDMHLFDSPSTATGTVKPSDLVSEVPAPLQPFDPEEEVIAPPKGKSKNDDRKKASSALDEIKPATKQPESLPLPPSLRDNKLSTKANDTDKKRKRTSRSVSYSEDDEIIEDSLDDEDFILSFDEEIFLSTSTTSDCAYTNGRSKKLKKSQPSLFLIPTEDNIVCTTEEIVTERTVHYNYRCDGCHVEPIVGARWHCLDCPLDCEVDLCENCVTLNWTGNFHTLDHQLVKYDEPQFDLTEGGEHFWTSAELSSSSSPYTEVIDTSSSSLGTSIDTSIFFNSSSGIFV